MVAATGVCFCGDRPSDFDDRFGSDAAASSTLLQSVDLLSHRLNNMSKRVPVSLQPARDVFVSLDRLVGNCCWLTTGKQPPNHGRERRHAEEDDE
jgi:hypothetical protein